MVTALLHSINALEESLSGSTIALRLQIHINDFIILVFIAVTQNESMVEPDGITDDGGWESMALVSIHEAILSISPR